MYGEKYEFFRVSLSISSKAILASFIFIICQNNFFSSGQRNLVAFMLSSTSYSMEILAIGVNSGGHVGSCGKVRSGFSGIWRVT